jgi:uncharacterized protein (TIGR02145 family)
MPMDYGDTLTVFATVGPANAANKAITWSLSNLSPAESILLTNQTNTSVLLNGVTDGVAGLIATAQDAGGYVSNAYEDTVGCGTNILVGSAADYYISYFGSAGCWTTQNMQETDGLIDGKPGSNVASQNYYFFTGTGYSASLGALYSWAAATGQTSVETNTTGTKYQGICPNGWHVPATDDFTSLKSVIQTARAGLYSSNSGSSSNIGTIMKHSATFYGQNPAGTSNTYLNHGFDGYLYGAWVSNADYENGTFGAFWTSESINSTTANAEYLLKTQSGLVHSPNQGKERMFNVRCKRDWK